MAWYDMPGVIAWNVADGQMNALADRIIMVDDAPGKWHTSHTVTRTS